MALPDSEKLVDGTAFIVAFDTDWPASPTLGWSATVDAEMDMSTITTGLYEQSVKLDLTANREEVYSVSMTMEMEDDPGAGDNLVLYVGYSDSVTAGTGNPAGLSGVAEAYSGVTTGTAAVGVQGLDLVGVLSLDIMNDADATPQVGHVGYFSPRGRYAMFVLHNNSGVSTFGTADEMALQVRGITKQIQD